MDALLYRYIIAIHTDTPSSLEDKTVSSVSLVSLKHPKCVYSFSVYADGKTKTNKEDQR